MPTWVNSLQPENFGLLPGAFLRSQKERQPAPPQESEFLAEIKALRQEIAELRAERRPSVILTGADVVREWKSIHACPPTS